MAAIQCNYVIDKILGENFEKKFFKHQNKEK